MIHQHVTKNEDKMDTTKKELLFSVTASDCDWSYTKGTGAGGQKRNKTSSAVHCTHRASKAHGYSEDTRSQLDNKKLAFQRMAATDKFKKWHQHEISVRTGQQAIIDANVEKEMKKIKVETRQDGKWTEVSPTNPLVD